MPKRSRQIEFHTFSAPPANISSVPTPAAIDVHLRNTEYTSNSSGITASTTYYCFPRHVKRSRGAQSEAVEPVVTVSGSNTEGDLYEDLTAEGADAEYFLQAFEDDLHSPRRRTAGDNPLHEWIKEIPLYLNEIIRLEGRCGLTTNVCAKCSTDGELYRCDDCEDLRLYCTKCTQIFHNRSPFHRIKLWMKTYFRRAILKDVGVRIQLGHPLDERCYNPIPGSKDFIVIDIGGIHEVAIDFCGCAHAESRTTQLLRARLLPATSVYPKSAATFRVLETFHLLSNQSKTSAFEYYNTLSRRTCNTGVIALKDRYVTFLRLIRMWRHLKLLKRAGRGHDPAGILATAEGSCAVLCPACPHPGKNLPDDWASAPSSRKWLYTLFVGLDANFRLKRKKVSSEEKDPGLNRGYAYFVENSKYHQFIDEFGKLQLEEASTCNNHDALKLAHLKGSNGTAASGVGTVECTRHDMKRPCSVGDLQKGERYVNMDYLFFSSMVHHSTDTVVISYDISCQWSRHIWDRLLKYEHYFDWERNLVTFLIPKFHLPAHQSSCQTAFSFNLTLNVGRTDGEAVERGWAAVNPFASSTKEMGPGARRDLLDDVFGDYNWRKICQLPEVFLTKMKEAIEERNEQMVAFQLFDAALPCEDTVRWKEVVEKWEKDAKQINPFVATRPNITLASARLRLAEEEAEAIAQGTSMTVHEKASASYMVAAGIDLEDQQRRLRADVAALGPHATDLQRAKVQEKRNSLQHQIDAWTDIQHLYIPGIVGLRAQPIPSDSPILAENFPLWMPSAAASKVSVDARILEHEWKLRFGQAHETLDFLRRHLRLRTHMYRYKDRFVRGQRENTRARTTITGVEIRVAADAARYRQAYDALDALSPRLSKTDWRGLLRPLRPEDVKGFEEDSTVSRDRVQLSWIWKTPQIERSGAVRSRDEGAEEYEDTQEALRIEWCKARARAARWWEECRLLLEEMRRVLAFHAWQASWWKEQAHRREEVASDFTEGLEAYAHRQADIRLEMRDRCRKVWAGIPEYIRVANAAIEVDDDESDITLLL